MQKSGCFSEATQSLLEPLYLVYHRQYQKAIELCQKQTSHSRDSLFLFVFALIQSNQLDEAEIVLKENHFSDNDVIMQFYCSIRNLQDCEQELLYSKVVVPLQNCLVTNTTGNLFSILIHRLFFEEVCLQLGNVYHSRLSNCNEAIKYYKQVFTVNQTSRSALKSIIPCCYEVHDYSLIISLYYYLSYLILDVKVFPFLQCPPIICFFLSIILLKVIL